ncbi:MAG: DEAD/DEAH box helicase [Moorea sp. SIO3H5]|nr:DEAD/DEAH box helicase [Moorena sp. SIO3H5]
MALLATFVGVNKHADPNISDLTGATKDAIALWALFSDSIPDITASRVVDEEATLTAIREALDETLGNASSDDTALFFFAGHGSPAHQLVPYDARYETLADTTIPMDELAERLSSSQARAVIVILDCCFSGGATTRVLQGVPTPRTSMTTITDLQGKGRVIIAASKDDEAAYELHGHGLLTQALLHTFKNNPNGVDIGAVMDEVTKWVRAEAQRFGWQQTPVVFNLVEGGLTFPPLTPGVCYAEAFPDTTNMNVGADIKNLTAFGLAPELLNAWADRFTRGLNDLQLKAVNEYRVLDERALLVVAPTSSGKTFIGEMAAAKAVTDGRKAVFLLPFKALTNEKYEDFNALYGDSINLRVIRCTGDYTDDTEDFVRGRYDIALLTYEMFLNLSLASPSLLNKIGLVVLDEAHFITDSQRGISVELLLTSLLAARERGIEPQIVALSAVIGHVNHFDEWLGCQTLFTCERPVPLIEGVLDRSGSFQYMGLDGEEHIEQFLPSHLIIKRKDKPSSQDIIVPLVEKLISEGEHVLIFRNQRGTAVGCSMYLGNALGLSSANNVLTRLPEHDLSGASNNLRQALKGGTAFHNSHLMREERLAVEQAFRDPEGNVRVLAATTTVAAGINTPASTVIIVETFFYGEERRDFTVAQYKNMAGRAGRLGLSKQGTSILLADNAPQRQNLFRNYVKGKPEAIRSSFKSTEIETWILRLLAQINQVPRKEVVRLLASTYSGYLESRKNPDWHEQTVTYLKELLERMESLGLVEEMEGQLSLTLLGKECGKSNFSFKSAMELVTLLKQVSGSLTAEKLMAYLQAIPEVGGYTSIFKKGKKESAWQREVKSHYGSEVTSRLQHGAKDIFKYYARCKRAAILKTWINGEPIEAIEQRFSVTRYAGSVGAGDVRGYADRTRLHLQAAFNIADIILLGEGPDETAIDTLLQQLETGLPVGALKLLTLPVSLPRGEYLALFNAGYTTAEAVLSVEKDELCKYIGYQRVEEILAQLELPN